MMRHDVRCHSERARALVLGGGGSLGRADGGIRSLLNAELAQGFSSVLVVSCFDFSSPATAPEPTRVLNDALRAELDRLRAAGSTVEVITPEEAILTLSGHGTKMLDGSLVPEAYAISRRMAQRESERIRALWI
jgi:NTE family protein